MIDSVKPPLFAFEGGDVSIFHSVNELESTLEGIDVLNGAYEAFDSEGFRLELEPRGTRQSMFVIQVGTVRVTGRGERDEASLAQHLRRHLRAVYSLEDDSWGLRDLIGEVVTRESRRGLHS